MYLPGARRYGDSYSEYLKHSLVTDIDRMHWPTLCSELAAIWIGYLIYKVITRDES